MTVLDEEGGSVVAKTVEIRAGDPLVVPDEFLRALGLEQGGVYTIVRLNGILIVTPKRLTSLDALESMRQVFVEEGTTLQALLSNLDAIRQELYQQHYGRRTEPT